MDQHPVPQNISSYEFRLVGDMTLKQFFQLAGGIGIGVLFTKLPLPFFFKWPFAGLSVLMGIMLAFVPVSGRPFSQWLMAFIRAIYSPTKYLWSSTPSQTMDAIVAPENNVPSSPLDKIESQVVSRISQLFNNQPVAQTAPAPTPTPVPTISVETSQPLPQATETTVHTMAPPMIPTSAPGTMEPKRPIMIAEIVDSPPTTPAQQAPAPPLPAPTPVVNVPPITPVVAQPQKIAEPAMFTDKVNTPERPNLIAGVVLGKAQEPLEGVILEITDSKNGIPVRALRTNKLGQFQTATPLSPGVYNLTAEKEGVSFDPVSLTCENQIIKPVLISAHA